MRRLRRARSVWLAAKVLGDHVVYVNATSTTMLAAYPYSSFNGSWLYTTMGSAPAGAQGIRDALDVLIAKGRLPKDEDVKVVVLGGDGSTYDMALPSTSGAMHRTLDFYYICYDNEAYGNTGMQLSAATPYAARTATWPCNLQHPAATTQEKKDILRSGGRIGLPTSQPSRRGIRWTWKKSLPVLPHSRDRKCFLPSPPADRLAL